MEFYDQMNNEYQGAVNKLKALHSNLPAELSEEHKVLIKAIIQSCKPHIENAGELLQKVKALDKKFFRRLLLLAPSSEDKSAVDSLLAKVRAASEVFSAKGRNLGQNLIA